jgi:hypothetical protein
MRALSALRLGVVRVLPEPFLGTGPPGVAHKARNRVDDLLEAGFAGPTREVQRMPQYMLLIYGDPANAPGADEQEAQYEAWTNYTNSLVASGAMVAGAPLEGVEQATTVRSRNGQVQTTEGPFAETQEILGGYYVVDVETRAEAEAMAAQMPNIEYGSVEVRPVVVFPDAA